MTRSRRTATRRRTPARRRSTLEPLTLITGAWRALAAGVALAASVVGLIAYFWPSGPGENNAHLSATLTPYRTFRAYRDAVFPNCTEPTSAPNCTAYPDSVLRQGPVLGLSARVDNLVGWRGTPLVWRWQLLRVDNSPVTSNPPGGTPREFVSNRDKDAFDLQPTPIFAPGEGGTFYVRVTLEKDPRHLLARACSKLVYVSARPAEYKAELRGNPVGC
jgi:hypothetical protein